MSDSNQGNDPADRLRRYLDGRNDRRKEADEDWSSRIFATLPMASAVVMSLFQSPADDRALGLATLGKLACALAAFGVELGTIFFPMDDPQDHAELVREEILHACHEVGKLAELSPDQATQLRLAIELGVARGIAEKDPSDG